MGVCGTWSCDSDRDSKSWRLDKEWDKSKDDGVGAMDIWVLVKGGLWFNNFEWLRNNGCGPIVSWPHQTPCQSRLAIGPLPLAGAWWVGWCPDALHLLVDAPRVPFPPLSYCHAFSSCPASKILPFLIFPSHFIIWYPLCSLSLSLSLPPTLW